MTNRMTGISGLIDTDALVEATLLRQKTKINTATQNLKIQQYKQEQYRTLMTQAKSFYNNYFDILSGNSLASTKAYNIMSAKSSDSNSVTATASTKAKTANYEVKVNHKAEGAKYQMLGSDLMSATKLMINNVEYELSGSTAKERVENLNKELKNNKAGVTASYSDFVGNGAGGLVLETESKGDNVDLSVYVDAVSNPINNIGTTTNGRNAINATTDQVDIETIALALADASSPIDADDINRKFSINGIDLTISDTDINNVKRFSESYKSISENPDSTEEQKNVAKTKVAEELAKGINNSITTYNNANPTNKINAAAEKLGGTIRFVSTIGGELDSSTGELEGFNNISYAGNTLVTNNGANATKAEMTLSSDDINKVISGENNNNTLIINGRAINYTKSITSSNDSNEIEAAKEANKNALKQALINAGIDIDYDNNKLTSRTEGRDGNFTVSLRDNTVGGVAQPADDGTDPSDASALGKVIKGKNADISIKNKDTGLTYTHTGNSNEITLDEVTFNIKDAPSDGSTVTINVKPDGSALKDKIVDFINDYNSLLGAINTKLYEEYDRSYKPLTDDDKEGLTDGQIEKLEKKAQTGLLRNDSYLTTFADQMKAAMSSVMKGSGLSLERIGITPKKDYTTENGLFEIDEDKLLSAIEKDPDGIKDLFLKGIANDSVSSDDGIMSKMTDIMKKQIVNFDSIFARKAGFSTGTYATINEMTLDIKDRQKKISELQDAYDTKEDLLYKKYASLESSLASLQSQQSSLSSYFG